MEILVVDQSAQVSPQLLAFMQAHSGVVRYHRVPFRGSAKARNYGWQHAWYDAIVFVDDDIRCGPTFLTEHSRTLHLNGVGLIAGAVDTPGRQRSAGRFTGRFAQWTATPVADFEAEGEFDCDHAPEGNFAVWRQVMVTVGGVDETFDVPAALYEGTDLSLRVKHAGLRVHFNGQARLLHLAAPGGGNRVLDVPLYFWGLARNRAILMRRYLQWFHQPVAVARLFLLALAYAVHYRRPQVLFALFNGYFAGLRAGGRTPYCTPYMDRKRDAQATAPVPVVAATCPPALDPPDTSALDHTSFLRKRESAGVT
jgi:GT2 family glycosyltransferase